MIRTRQELEAAIAAGKEAEALLAAMPVDPKRKAIEAIVEAYHTTRVGQDYVTHILAKPRVQYALAALAERPLTREMVRDAVEAATLDFLLAAQDGDDPDAFEFRIKRLHAALTEQVQP